MKLDKKQAADIIQGLFAQGGDFGELFCENKTVCGILFDDNRLENILKSMSQGASLRIVAEDSTYFASSNDISYESLLMLARKLSESVLKGKQSEDQGINIYPKSKYEFAEMQPLESLEIDGPNIIEINPSSLPLETKIALVRQADAIIREYDTRIIQATVVYRESIQDVAIYNSEGVYGTERRVQLVLSCRAVAADGKGNIQTGSHLLGAAKGFEIFSQEALESVAREAARIAILQLEAEDAPAGSFAVVLHSSAGGTMIHEAVGHGLEGDFINKGLSVYAGKINEMVASDLITVIDDGTMPGYRGSEKMDDEGVASSKVLLIDKGKLVGFLHDKKSARESGSQVTGNGRRESFRHLPIPRMRNTYIAPGQHDPDQIISSVKEGILVSKMGGGQVDIVNGNFVFNVSEGYWIKDGQRGAAIKGATLTGNGPQVMKAIDMVGNDLGFSIGTCGKNGQAAPVSDAQPTLRIPKMVIGGVLDGS